MFGEDPTSYSINGKLPTGFVFHEAAWQPTSFYMRNLTNSLPPDNELSGRVAGRSTNAPWLLNRSGRAHQLWLASKNNNDPGRAVAKEATSDAQRRLQSARGLWIHLLLPGSLRWVGTNRFEAKADLPAEALDPNAAECTIAGQITALDDKGRPAKIEYNYSAFKRLGNMSLDMYYGSPVGDTELPSVVVSTMEILSPMGIGVNITTNVLDYVEIGTDHKMGSEGYVPGAFLSSKVPLTVIVSSNGINYRMNGNKLSSFAAKPGFKKARNTVGRYIFFALAILSAPCFWFFGRKKMDLK